MYKKLLLAITAFVIFSCSSNEESVDNISPALPNNSLTDMPKEFIRKNYQSNGALSFSLYGGNLIYEGLDLKQSILGNLTATFTYDGNKIIKVTDSDNNGVLSEKIISYQNDKIISIENNYQISTFEYENDVLKRTKLYYKNTGNLILDQEVEYFYENSNVVKENYIKYGTSISRYRYEYEYDDKNNPFNRVNQYVKYIFGSDAGMYNARSANNIVSVRKYSDFTTTVIDSQIDLNITYNSRNYPIFIEKLDPQSVWVRRTIDISYH